MTVFYLPYLNMSLKLGSPKLLLMMTKYWKFWALGINKAHGHDEISMRMLKLCDKSTITALSILFQNYIDTKRKKSNIVPIHKKGDKQIVDNYRPVSLLLILGKHFQRIILNSIFEYLEENNLICPYQSGFRPSDFCEY